MILCRDGSFPSPTCRCRANPAALAGLAATSRSSTAGPAEKLYTWSSKPSLFRLSGCAGCFSSAESGRAPLPPAWRGHSASTQSACSPPACPAWSAGIARTAFAAGPSAGNQTRCPPPLSGSSVARTHIRWDQPGVFQKTANQLAVQRRQQGVADIALVVGQAKQQAVSPLSSNSTPIKRA